MSLRAFHLLFIALSVMLAIFCAAWCVEQYQVTPELTYAAAGVLALATAGALVVYGVAFQRKTRSLS
jgi:predicted membrane protein